MKRDEHIDHDIRTYEHAALMKAKRDQARIKEAICAALPTNAYATDIEMALIEVLDEFIRTRAARSAKKREIVID